MPAPRIIPLGNPAFAGFDLVDGFRTLMVFSEDPDCPIWEKTITPPGMEQGDLIDTSTMRNLAWRTFASRSLTTLTEMTVTGAYDPVGYISLSEMMGVLQEITIYFPDTSAITFWGSIKTVEFAEMSESTQPEVTVTVVPHNCDLDGNEFGPIYGGKGQDVDIFGVGAFERII